MERRAFLGSVAMSVAAVAATTRRAVAYAPGLEPVFEPFDPRGHLFQSDGVHSDLTSPVWRKPGTWENG